MLAFCTRCAPGGSEKPRGGSFTVRNRISAISRPGRPSAMKAKRQPKFSPQPSCSWMSPTPNAGEEADDRLVGQPDDETAEAAGQRAADRDAHGEDAERVGPALRLEVVADDRVGGRRAARFTDGDADARDQQEHEAGGKAAQRGHQRPDRDAQRHDGDAVEPVGRHRDRNAHQRVEQRERRTVEEAVLGVASARTRR